MGSVPGWKHGPVGQFLMLEEQEAGRGFPPETLGKLRLRKSSLLRKGWEFERVYSKGSRLHGNGFTLIYSPNISGHGRLGISVHRKIRGAVKRNRIKRIIRESFRLHPEQYPHAMDVVFAVRPGFSLSCPSDICMAVASFSRRVLTTPWRDWRRASLLLSWKDINTLYPHSFLPVVVFTRPVQPTLFKLLKNTG